MKRWLQLVFKYYWRICVHLKSMQSRSQWTALHWHKEEMTRQRSEIWVIQGQRVMVETARLHSVSRGDKKGGNMVRSLAPATKCQCTQISVTATKASLGLTHQDQDSSWPLLCWPQSCPACWAPRAFSYPPTEKLQGTSKVQSLGGRKTVRGQLKADPCHQAPQEVRVTRHQEGNQVLEHEPPLYFQKFVKRVDLMFFLTTIFY